MKKKFLLFVASFLMFSIPVFAISGSVYLSSHTATANTTQALCQQAPVGSNPHGVLNSVCVNTGASTSSATIYNSSGTANNVIAIIDTTTKGCLTYNVLLSSGITYTTSSTADVTFLYQCY